MSHVQEPGICYCACHTHPEMRHCVPCCQGPCPVCGKNVAYCSNHVEKCRARIDARIKAMQEATGGC
jgi:hypothetical protein